MAHSEPARAKRRVVVFPRGQRDPGTVDRELSAEHAGGSRKLGAADAPDDLRSRIPVLGPAMREDNEFRSYSSRELAREGLLIACPSQATVVRIDQNVRSQVDAALQQLSEFGMLEVRTEEH